MTYKGMEEIFEGDFADTGAKKLLLKLWRAEQRV
jgi:hypothetical protein